MEKNTKRLQLLLKFLNIGLVLIAISMVFYFYFTFSNALKFHEYAVRSPKYNSNGYGVAIGALTYFNVLKTIMVRLFYGVLLWNIRSIVKGILKGESFQDGQANSIRKLAIYLLWFAGVLVAVVLVFLIATLSQGNPKAVKTSIKILIVIFQNYVLTALIAFGIAEIFNAGKQLQQEKELTI